MSLLPPQMVEGLETKEGEMSKLTNDELKDIVRRGTSILWREGMKYTKAYLEQARDQLLTLLEEPKDGDVKIALKSVNDDIEILETCSGDNYYPCDFYLSELKTIRKALIHYGNMPKEAYRHNEKLTREETT